MTPDFEAFFRANGLFGKIHAITHPPKSKRNLDKAHPMDSVCENLSKQLGVPYVPVFAPWEKKRRGRFAEKPKVEVLPAVKDLVGKVVFVLDDVSTTNYTLKSSVRALTTLEVHAHGLCWVLYS